MIDIAAGSALRVSKDDLGGPYIILPVAQLDEVTSLLDANEVPYWVDELAISLDGKPETTVINLGRHCDPDTVQQILDGKG